MESIAKVDTKAGQAAKLADAVGKKGRQAPITGSGTERNAGEARVFFPVGVSGWPASRLFFFLPMSS